MTISAGVILETRMAGSNPTRAEREMADAEAEASRRLAEWADEVRRDMESQLHEALPGNHSAGDTIFLAHLMTCHDGYNDVVLMYDWEQRPTTDWGTSLGLLVMVGGVVANFILECRCEGFRRQLAINMNYGGRPGERLPQQMEQERLLLAMGCRVMSFAEVEVLENPEMCRTRVEAVLHEMATDVLRDAGRIS